MVNLGLTCRIFLTIWLIFQPLNQLASARIQRWKLEQYWKSLLMFLNTWDYLLDCVFLMWYIVCLRYLPCHIVYSNVLRLHRLTLFWEKNYSKKTGTCKHTKRSLYIKKNYYFFSTVIKRGDLGIRKEKPIPFWGSEVTFSIQKWQT